MATLIESGKVLIEVGLNEVASKDQNPHVPYDADEVARDIVACSNAGAAVVHFHARYADGTQAKTDDDVYRRAMELAAAEADVLMWPTAFPLGGHPSSAAELPHHWALVDKPPKGAPLRIGAFDAWRIGRRPFIGRDGDLRPMIKDGFGPDYDRDYRLSEALTAMEGDGLLPTFCCYELGDVRWVREVAKRGVIRTPVRIEVLLYDDWVYGPSAQPAAIDAFLSEWQDTSFESELTVVPYGVSDPKKYEALLRHSLDRGVNIRVGIGDCPVAFPTATNSDMVEWAISIAADYGLKPASTREVVERLNLT